MIAVIVLILGFALLLKGADLLVAGSSALAKKIGVSDLVIGLTVVSFGTSTPEMIVNIFASAQGNSEIAIANVIGSNIFNILLILGVSALIYPLAVSKGTVFQEIPFSLLAVLILGALTNDTLFDQTGSSTLTQIDGFVFIVFFGIFLRYIVSIIKRVEHHQHGRQDHRGSSRPWPMIIGGLLGLVLGGKLVVDGAVIFASRLGVSESLIGLTIVAAGTSLPELATSAVAAYRKNSDIAVGNIVGSNIFNILFILGVSALIKPLPITAQSNADILVLAIASLLLFFFMFTGKRRMLDRWEGAIFILLYVGYTIHLIQRG